MNHLQTMTNEFDVGFRDLSRARERGGEIIARCTLRFIDFSIEQMRREEGERRGPRCGVTRNYVKEREKERNDLFPVGALTSLDVPRCSWRRTRVNVPLLPVIGSHVRSTHQVYLLVSLVGNQV